eukprot:1545536-Prymnesium_polylepis.1
MVGAICRTSQTHKGRSRVSSCVIRLTSTADRDLAASRSVKSKKTIMAPLARGATVTCGEGCAREEPWTTHVISAMAATPIIANAGAFAMAAPMRGSANCAIRNTTDVSAVAMPPTKPRVRAIHNCLTPFEPAADITAGTVASASAAIEIARVSTRYHSSRRARPKQSSMSAAQTGASASSRAIKAGVP